MTTYDLLIQAQTLSIKADYISDRADHAAFWDRKVDILNKVNDALETGYFNGEALEDLRTVKRILERAERIAGQRAKESYLNNQMG